ncbi:MAG TPA: metallophosphoesterase family protein [Candidatus Hydrogenedentes bacterium]|nr:metallophosphoesterase family protein [Candidatus Hydrogenedentota bacterium]
MRYAVISDIHANIDALETVYRKIQSIGVDEIFCLGDVVGYNAAPNECVEFLAEREILTILGNHDAVACGLEEPWGFNPVALRAALWTREKLSESALEWLKNLPDALNFGDFVAVHGAPKNHNAYLFSWEDILPHLGFMEEQNCSLCFVGHTHCPAIHAPDGSYRCDGNGIFPIREGEIFFINPGSVGQPRDEDPRAAFGIIDTETRTFEQVRLEYPVEKASSKVIEAGLPKFLAERLLVGR